MYRSLLFQRLQSAVFAGVLRNIYSGYSEQRKNAACITTGADKTTSLFPHSL